MLNKLNRFEDSHYIGSGSEMFYDSFAKRRRNRLGAFLVAKLLRKLSKIAAGYSPVKVLEIGVGKGLFYEQLKKDVPQMQYTGIEASDTLYKEAESNGINAVKCFVPPFPPELERESFDLVVMINVLEHFRDYREVLGVLNGINDLLKTDGKLLLYVPCSMDWGKEFYDCDYSHSYFITRNRVDNLLSDSGYQVIKRDSYRACFNNFRWFFYIFSKVADRLPFFNLGMRQAFKKSLLTVARKSVRAGV